MEDYADKKKTSSASHYGSVVHMADARQDDLCLMDRVQELERQSKDYADEIHTLEHMLSIAKQPIYMKLHDTLENMSMKICRLQEELAFCTFDLGETLVRFAGSGDACFLVDDVKYRGALSADGRAELKHHSGWIEVSYCDDGRISLHANMDSDNVSVSELDDIISLFTAVRRHHEES